MSDWDDRANDQDLRNESKGHRGFPSEAEACRLFQKHCRYDPYYEEIEPALLNSWDVHRYIRRTGMVYPYSYDHLKSASYSICVGNKIYYWDDSGNPKGGELKDGEPFELPKNSIVFVETLETFRLPDYIAIRFNLKIDLVHKGILLGTGPLVDPGYEGKLLIPLHNLTSNTYQLYSGQTFVWVEFTKTSAWPAWREEGESDYPEPGFRPFPKRKKNLSSVEYLTNAFPSAIRSSIPDVLWQTKSKADQARYISGAVMVSVIVLVVTMLMLAYQVVDHAFSEQSFLESQVDELERRIENLEDLE
ncbi:dCTP deaminase domain-containing protein [Aquisalimonas asiatica]|uniref:Deoxycytidine triphosphate deaminase n=1 Tax=Aquisalimonas asiatica TaxID=406100 RepID=A0A1H8SZG4_9GAMM|nr:hypothetical protein [Aquisalimonas asiatica]SEO84091.1 deoxycytidine triphosphate deaminase [Aquisalimonas asiatica]